MIANNKLNYSQLKDEWSGHAIKISELCSQLLHSHHVPPPTHTSTHQFTFSLQSLVECHTLLVVEGRG